jgi:GTP-binding protein
VRPRLFYATQTASAPPTITIFCSAPERITAAYERFLLNRLRATFDLEGTPVRLKFRARPRRGDAGSGPPRTRKPPMRGKKTRTSRKR